MVSFANFFNRGKPKDTQQGSDAPKKQEFTGVMQAVVEETIMATAYWLIGLVNSSLENKAASSAQVEEQIIEKPMTATEELVPKVIGLIEQLHDRTQSIITLENRLCTVETSLKEDAALGQSAQAPNELISNLEKRFVEVKQLAKDLEGLTEALQQSNQTTTALENRIAHLEKLLSEYSVVPKLLKQNCQTIATLQQRLLLLEVSQGKNHHLIAK
ncbi:MAG: hypothetical protein KME13_14285 [Myxacorys californica WJT36-NPBG1]|jgi:predicted RNase H-like nuclease (RuvC/YqgF family)|nr:hypothetical protein [Myxacorys californica WJT36-NPBG1]